MHTDGRDAAQGCVMLRGTGAYLPDRVVHNDTLAARLDTSHEWIFSHTGIVHRCIAADDQATSDLATLAARKALQAAEVDAAQLGLIIVATSTPDYFGFPSTACIVQNQLGASTAGAFDLGAACSGFIYALELGRSFVAAHRRPVLVIGAEIMSRMLNWEDRNTCVLFGDGAGAAVLDLAPASNEGQPARGIVDSLLRADGSGAALLQVDGGYRLKERREASGASFLEMQGKRVFNFAVRALGDVICHFLDKHDLRPEQVDHVVPHQANYRILKAASNRSSVPQERFFVNMENTANTSAASIPIALAEMDQKGLLEPGQCVITAGFGAGLTYGGNLIRW